MARPEAVRPQSDFLTSVDDLRAGDKARIIAIRTAEPPLEARLREIGFCEGDEVELLTRGPIGGHPLAVRLNRRIIAMRRDEARAIRVNTAHD